MEDIDRGYWKPFDLMENEYGSLTLYLHGTEDERKAVDAKDTPKILEAIKNGWHIDIQYADIEGEIDIGDAGLDKDEHTKFVLTDCTVSHMVVNSIGSHLLSRVVVFLEVIAGMGLGAGLLYIVSRKKSTKSAASR